LDWSEPLALVTKSSLESSFGKLIGDGCEQVIANVYCQLLTKFLVYIQTNNKYSLLFTIFYVVR
jgi:hypothetical protein